MPPRRRYTKTKKSDKNKVKRVYQAPQSENTAAPIEDIERSSATIPPVLSVKEFSEILNLPVTKVIGALIRNGVIATINENIDADTATIIGDELGFDITVEQEKSNKPVAVISIDKPEDLVLRPPVVTVMGHVDHGKTTLLDSIRKTDVVASESGGITQHIGAYQVKVSIKDEPGKERLVTFLDTPGHEAFSAMRAHGAAMTDIVILVVAADDGVKPQTIEVIKHAKHFNVPIIVAINKIDVPGANLERVKQELSERELVPEEWGGKTIMVPISAKKGENISTLLDMVILTSDLKELKTNPNKSGTGLVIESHMQAGIGPLATVLVTDGTLKVNDFIVIGHTYGKIRIMEDFRAKRIKIATASTPVRIAGLQDVPQFGEPVTTVSSEKEARQMTQVKSAIHNTLSIAEASDAVSEKKKHKELNIILKTDFQGSLEAVRNSVISLNTAGVTVKIIHDSVGEITESDVNMAAASNALIIGFRVSVKPQVKQLSERTKVKITIYDIIYKLLDDLFTVLSGLVEPEFIEVKIGTGKVLKIFRSEKNDMIVGILVTSGRVTPDSIVKILRAKEEVSSAKITSLQQGQSKVDMVDENKECGISLETNYKIEEGDTLEFLQKEEKIIS